MGIAVAAAWFFINFNAESGTYGPFLKHDDCEVARQLLVSTRNQAFVRAVTACYEAPMIVAVQP